MTKHRIRAWLHAAAAALNNRNSSRLPVSLHLENLERRDVPSVAANDVFVASLYQGLLGRKADPGGIAYWDSQLNAGQSRSQIAIGIESSDEFIGRAIQIYYKDFLGRPGDSDGVNFWVNEVRQGVTLEQAKAGILGSGEFYNHNGGTLNTYINAVYESQLGRQADAGAVSYWSGITVNTDDGRAATALKIMDSAEGERVKVTGYYELLLGRLPSANEENYWLGAIQSGAGNGEVVADIVASPEYYGEVQFFAASGTDANDTAHLFIVTTHRFSGTHAGAEELNSDIPTDPNLVLPPSGGGGGSDNGGSGGGGGGGRGGFIHGPGVSIGFGVSVPVTAGPVVTVGSGDTGGFTNGNFDGGFTGGGGESGGGFTGGGGDTGGGGGDTGGGGGSGSLRAAVPHDRTPNGGVGGVGGRGKGAGFYVTGGLLTLTGSKPISSNSPVDGPAIPPALANDAAGWQRPFNTLAQLQALEAANPVAPQAGQLTNQQLQQTVSTALTMLEHAGVSQKLLVRLESATYEVGNLPGPLVGYTFSKDMTVVIDATADGYGWYVDPNSQSDAAFTRTANGVLSANANSPASGHMDLLTTVLHEMGHLAGFSDVNPQTHPNNLMDTTLPTGVRRTDALDAVFTGGFA